MKLLTCTIVTSDTANNYANTQNGRLQSTEPTNQKNKLKTLFDIIFKPDLGRSF